MKKGLLGILIGLMLLTLGVFAVSSAEVFVIPLEAAIDPGLASFVERSYREAELSNTDLVLLEIDTPGGRIDAAEKIKQTINESTLKTIALVKGGAISAGAYLALACPEIAMLPGAIIGDAEPQLGGKRADEKLVSYWAAEMGAAAEKNGRERLIAMAMADRDLEIPGLVEKGKLLTLTYQQAKEYGYTDYLVANRAELLKVLNLAEANIKEAVLSPAEKITRLITHPFLAPLLLTLGIAGLIIEVFTVGWGIAGFIGLFSLSLYFGGHLLAGFTGWEAILLFLLGLILLAIEIFIPGFGLPGISGLVCLVISIVLAAPSWEAGIISLVLAIIGTIILLLFSFKFLTKRGFWERLVLGIKYQKETGYVPQSKDLSIYVGQRGVALTILRPAGTIELADGTKLDVVTEGEFIPRGENVEIILAEGIRVVVRALRE